MKIPTAEEFISRTHSEVPVFLEDIEILMVEYAKLHVTEALKQASEKAKTRFIPFTDDEEVDKQSIFNAYPLENIK